MFCLNSLDWASIISQRSQARQFKHLNSVAKQIFMCDVEPVGPADTANSQSWVSVRRQFGRKQNQVWLSLINGDKNWLWTVHSYLRGSLVQKFLMDSCLGGFNCKRLSIWLILVTERSQDKALLVWNCSICLLQRISLVEPAARQGRLKQLAVFVLRGGGDSLLSSTPSSVPC